MTNEHTTAAPSALEIAARYTRPQPDSADYTTRDHYMVWGEGIGTCLIPRGWYDARRVEVESCRAWLVGVAR